MSAINKISFFFYVAICQRTPWCRRKEVLFQNLAVVQRAQNRLVNFSLPKSTIFQVNANGGQFNRQAL